MLYESNTTTELSDFPTIGCAAESTEHMSSFNVPY